MKRIITGSLAVITLLVGISIFSTKPSQVVYAGDSESPANSQSTSYFQDTLATEVNQSKLVRKQPPVTVDHSLERDNLNKRLEFTNNANQLGYVYLLSDMGAVISEYTVMGKVSSLNSYITQMEQIKCVESGNGYEAGRYACESVEAPDLDGSYGSNPDGIFFFTTEGAYIEWSGKYLYSTQGMNINTAVTLTRTVQ